MKTLISLNFINEMNFPLLDNFESKQHILKSNP